MSESNKTKQPETELINLEGLKGAVLASVPVRDELGYTRNLALPCTDEGVRFDTLLDAFGLDTLFVSFEAQVAEGSEAQGEYEAGNGCAGWTPVAPEGEDWQLAEVYDSENGVYAMFVRETPPPVLISRRHARATALSTPSTETSGDQAPSDVSTDQLIELTAHLERVRARAIVEAVQKIGTAADPANAISHFCGWATALEEVAHRLKTEAWGMLPNGGWGPTGAANNDDRPSPEFPALLRRALATPQHVELEEQAKAELERSKRVVKMLSEVIQNLVVGNQAAWIEWQHGKGAEAAMGWISNGLKGPGHIPDDDEPYGKEAQAWYDANCADPMPQCFCGRPSNIGWMGHGFCCDAHYKDGKASAQQAASAEGSA